ncbi:response regulator transcription factor [Stackebrandtia endophytica]|uniref:helix-turn-helix transcriptional regulator n=1 Tax=Stackebrandtia endophytica TaxID=1496996 RepID=UPI001B880442|nr:response regulator transcription factor [Stackebrandtia endophytica]
MSTQRHDSPTEHPDEVGATSVKRRPVYTLWIRLRSSRPAMFGLGVALLFFGWAMPMVGLTFALIERGVEQWWILLAFGLLMPVIAVFTVSVALSTRLRYLGGHPAPETAQATTHSASIEPDSASSTSRTGTVPVEPLSPREQDVLVLLESGRSNREIATMLYIAPGTVKAHLSHIFRKLQATTRLQAVNHAREAGILDTPDRE